MDISSTAPITVDINKHEIPIDLNTIAPEHIQLSPKGTDYYYSLLIK